MKKLILLFKFKLIYMLNENSENINFKSELVNLFIFWNWFFFMLLLHDCDYVWYLSHFFNFTRILRFLSF